MKLSVRFPYTDSFSNLGLTYSPPRGYSYLSNFSQSFLAGSYYFNPDEIETFYDVAFTSQGKFEYWLASLYIVYSFPGILTNNKFNYLANLKSCRD